MLDPNTRAAILRLHQQGHSSRKIAEDLRISRGSVKAVIRSGAVECAQIERSSVLEEHLEAVQALHARCRDGRGNVNLVRVREKLIEDLAKQGRKLEVSYSALTWFCREHGIGVKEKVPAARIVVGELPLNTVLPAIDVSEVDSIPLNFIEPNQTPKMHTDRVQVRAQCKGPQSATAGTGRAGLQALLRLILAACPNQRGSINGVAVESIVPDTQMIHPYDDIDLIHSGSRDFIVRWNAT